MSSVIIAAPRWDWVEKNLVRNDSFAPFKATISVLLFTREIKVVMEAESKSSKSRKTNMKRRMFSHKEGLSWSTASIRLEHVLGSRRLKMFATARTPP